MVVCAIAMPMRCEYPGIALVYADAIKRKELSRVLAVK